MTDKSPMPFGKYAGTPMEKVPAQYLLWLWDKDDGIWMDDGFVEGGHLDLHNYIKESFSALEQECPDFIVKHRPS